jgi:hypothetical protein
MSIFKPHFGGKIILHIQRPPEPVVGVPMLKYVAFISQSFTSESIKVVVKRRNDRVQGAQHLCVVCVYGAICLQIEKKFLQILLFFHQEIKY